MDDAKVWRPRPALLILGLAVLAAVVFLPALSGGWIYDDRPLIAENPYVHSLHWWPRWFVTDFWDVNEEIVGFGQRMIYWRPLVTASYAVDWQLGGGSPLVFHLANTLYHVAVALLAFVALRRWIGAAVPAAVAALVFAIHPTKAESVAWIAGRTDVLCMLALLVATEGIARRRRGERIGLVLEAAGTAVAYACKEQAIVLPVFAAVEAWVAAQRPPIDLATVRRLVVAALPQAAIAIGYLVVRALVMPITADSVGAAPGASDHVQAVLESFGRFLTLTFAPHDLSIQHGLVHVVDGRMVHSLGYMIIGAVGMTALIAAAVLLRRRWPVATVGIAFYLVTLLPTSNIKYTQMQTLISERFLYLPVFGLALILGAALARARGAWVVRAYALTGACAIALGALSLRRSGDFADEDRFWAREQSLHWDSREALFYKLRVAHRERRFAASLQILLEIKQVLDRHDPTTPDDVRITYKVAEALARLTPDRDVDALRAIDAFCRDMLDPGAPSAQLDVRGVRLAIGRKSQSYQGKLRHIEPQLVALRADLNSRLGQTDEALRLVARASEICATCGGVVAASTIVHARAGHYTEALAVLERVAERMAPGTVAGLRELVEKARAAHVEAAASQGPAQLRARASELATLELWGRAYEVLAPYKDEIKRAPGFAAGFAELAFRAGEVAVAREVLSAVVPAPEIDARLDEWAVKMGWVE